MKRSDQKLAKAIQDWFKTSVTFEDEPYVIDLEQATAVIDDNNSTIVAARAGSGKTRTIVAKIVYLVAKQKIKPDEIMVFVFNANAAKEINARLSQMKVNQKPIIEDAKIASTFHAFSRQVVYNWCGGKAKCKEILAEQKEDYLLYIVKQLMKEEIWEVKIKQFLLGDLSDETLENLWQRPEYVTTELERFAKMMAQFVNRAQQKYLGSGSSLGEKTNQYLKTHDVESRERLFIELGNECYNRYHRYLLSKNPLKSSAFSKYGTDFNLIVSWASKLIEEKRGKTKKLLAHKKYLLIDEYQDFSQLFLYAVFAIRSVASSAKLFVVGDDLQAINRFAGSEVEYFKNFEDYFGKSSSRLAISTNYRCGYEIVRVAHKFMKKAMHDKGSFKAFSKKSGQVISININLIEYHPAMTDYDPRANKEDQIYQKTLRKLLSHSPKITTAKYLKVLTNIIKENKSANNILILHRNNEMNIESISLEQLQSNLRKALIIFNIMDSAEFDQKIHIMTMHKSKGLEAEVVIILEADEGVIPKTHPDTSLYTIFGETNEIALLDQKRLFYVAITRAKKKLYIIHDQPTKNSFIKFLGKNLNSWQDL